MQEIYYYKISQVRSCVNIKPLQNGEIALSFTDVGKSCPSHELLTSQICLLTLFAKINVLQKIFEFTVFVQIFCQIWLLSSKEICEKTVL